MMYKSKSGSLKRKEKEKKDTESQKGQTTLTSFVKRARQDEDEKSEEEESVDDVQEMDDDLGEEPNEAGEADVTEMMDMTRDIGNFDSNVISDEDVQKLVSAGPGELPEPGQIESDMGGKPFPYVLFTKKLANGETVKRDYLCYSQKQKALYCFPCRLFHHTCPSTSVPSNLAKPCGSDRQMGFWRLYKAIPTHENSNSHRQCYLKWKNMQSMVQNNATVDSLLQKDLNEQIQKWRDILHRILDVIRFLGERSLPFRGHSEKLGDPHNGNFLGILELLSTYDPILKEHVNKVKKSQQEGKRLQAHYFSHRIQDEFIQLCGHRIRQAILSELASSKYYSIMVDATPDISCTEQATFIFRYLLLTDGSYEIKERFFSFIDDNGKTGAEIAELLFNVLDENEIPLSDCRGQGYDNAANMKGEYNGVQAKVNEKNAQALYSPCGCHSLNLCGNDAADCCKEAITFFGTLNWFFTFFHSSPKRWEILVAIIDHSLHQPSTTRWSAKIKAVVPFKSSIPQLASCLQKCLPLKLTPKVRSEVNGAIKYIQSFECILMACIWEKILRPIDACNNAIQCRDATLDVEVDNLESCIQNLKEVGANWPGIVSEATEIAEAANVEAKLPSKRQDHQLTDMQRLTAFKEAVLDKILTEVQDGIAKRFESVREITSLFSFLWQYLKLTEAELTEKCSSFSQIYQDVDKDELLEELKTIKLMHHANFGRENLSPFKLINKIKSMNFEQLFPYLLISLRIFLTLPVSVATAERSFSKLKLIKNHLRSLIGQQKLADLAVMGIESDLTRSVNFDDIIDAFAKEKARKAPL